MTSWKRAACLLLTACLLLGGCDAMVRAIGLVAPHPSEFLPVPRDFITPQTLHIQRDDGQEWLLVVQQEGPPNNHDSILRFSLFDPLGVPLSRQKRSKGKWRNVGLLPPNREARALFITLLEALNDDLPAYRGWHAEPVIASIHTRYADDPQTLRDYLHGERPGDQPWPSLRLCQNDGYCYQFTPVQTQ